jgi:hypothetical protein
MILISSRNLSNWLSRMKRDLPYYEECNSAGIEMFRNWVKSGKAFSIK